MDVVIDVNGLVEINGPSLMIMIFGFDHDSLFKRLLFVD